MNTWENRRWAVVGPLSVALWVVGIILINRNGPADHATGSQILAWYKADTDTIVLGAWLFMLGCLGFVTFVAGLRVRLTEAAGRASQLPMLMLVGAGMEWTCRITCALPEARTTRGIGDRRVKDFRIRPRRCAARS